MSSISFDNYTRLAENRGASHTVVAGRYDFQAEAERRIIGDVVAKLQIDSGDRLLEIGCGPGNLLMPLSHMVASATGIDNAPALQRLCARGGDAMCVETLAGNFLEVEFGERRFDKVLVYSVVQYLDTLETTLRFLHRALALLAPGGRMLLGDLPNTDKKARFAASASGREVAREWQALTAGAPEHLLSALPADGKLLKVNDELVARLLTEARRAGHESYLLPQPSTLPFGYTREDLLFIAQR